MGIRDCLISAVDQGAITREEATALGDEYEERFAQLRASLGDDAARGEAKARLERALRFEAAEKRRRANLTEARRRGVLAQLMDYRNAKGEPDVFEAAMSLLSHYGYRGVNSLRGRKEAIISLAHGKLSDLMVDARRTAILGRRKATPMIDDIARALRGETVDDALAQQHAKAIAAVFEDLRQRFNAAGGAIPKLDNWGLPQSHDRLKIRALSADPAEARRLWKDRIRPLLDPDAMRHPLTGDPVGAGGIDRVLDHVYASIVSDDWAHRTPQMVNYGRGVLATQRADHRFLVFKDTDAWLTYNRQFGHGDIIQSIFDHINDMANDIATLETLGPSPNMMMDYIKAVVGVQLGRGMAGTAPAAGSTGASAIAVAHYRLDSLFQYLRGRPTASSGFAQTTGDIKNVVYSAILGATGIIAGLTDPFISQASRRLAGIPAMKNFGQMLKSMRLQGKQDIIRAGVAWEEYLHVMQDEARFAGIVIGRDWSRWLVDRSMMVSLLKPLTAARKLTEARAIQGHLADHAGLAFDALPDRTRRTMAGFGIGQPDWDVIRAGVDANGFVTPAEIARQGGEVRYLDERTATPEDWQRELKAIRHRDAAEKLAEFTASWAERAVPGGTPNIRSTILGATPRGTIPGELVDFFTDLKGFGLSFTALQIEATAQYATMTPGGQAARMAAGAKYFAALAVPLTLAGAVYIQLKAMADGKDPEPMGPENTDFWLRAAIQGGGFGLLGDFIHATEDRFGNSLVETLAGPRASFVGDTLKISAGNAVEAGAEISAAALGARWPEINAATKAGREATQFAGRWTPILSSHWATRAAYRRLILDQLQWAVDPDADKSFKRKLDHARRERGQDYWWKPGESAPRRPPDPAGAFGR